MKKIVLSLAIVSLLFSCNKQEDSIATTDGNLAETVGKRGCFSDDHLKNHLRILFLKENSLALVLPLPLPVYIFPGICKQSKRYQGSISLNHAILQISLKTVGHT